jgi:hypothetical protein
MGYSNTIVGQKCAWNSERTPHRRKSIIIYVAGNGRVVLIVTECRPMTCTFIIAPNIGFSIYSIPQKGRFIISYSCKAASDPDGGLH